MPPTLTSSSNVLTVVFKSDSSIAHDGFSASYTALDGSLGMISHKRTCPVRAQEEYFASGTTMKV